jgi:endonuclease/exonuclease/phosphatase family metal-dependent hydrolase
VFIGEKEYTFALVNTAILYLRDPFDKTMGRALECMFSYAPFKAGYKKSLAEKVQFVFTTIFYVAIIPLSLTLFGVALSVNGIRQMCNKHRFTYLEGSALEKKGSLKTILTWNVCALFGGLCIPFGGMAPFAKRASLIARKIIDTNADLVALQEVSPPAADMLYRKLRKEYKHFYVRINPDPLLTLDSGLFIASKVKLNDPTVISLPLAGRMKRAFFSFHVNEYNFLTTHLEPGTSEADVSMRQRQVAALFTHVVPSEKTVIMGDLNIERGREFEKSGLASRFVDRYEGEPTATDHFIGKVDEHQSIDYILTTPDLKLDISMNEGFNLDGPALSDHHMLIANLP